jgi:hypothetical protein
VAEEDILHNQTETEMVLKNKTPFILFLLFACSYLLAFPDVKYDQLFTDEDSWIENMSALAFLIASVLFFLCYWKSSNNGLNIGRFRTNRNLVFLGLALLFFVAFGEEISWGQRIFGWSTPESLAKVNYQQETNLHNLDFFTFKSETDDSFWSFLFVLNAGRIFFYFWFSFLVILPLSVYFSPTIKRFIKRFNIPVPVIWLGFLMIANLILAKTYKLLMKNGRVNYDGSIDEIMEGNYAIVILVLAVYFFKGKRYLPMETN